MLPTAERARKSSVFTRAYTARRSVSSGCLTLYVLHRFTPRRLAKAKGGAQAVGAAKALNSVSGASAGQSSQPEQVRAAAAGITISGQIRLLVGFSIAKKVLKSACKRNRCKRRAREAYRAVRSEAALVKELSEGLSNWYALVFVISPDALKVTFEELKTAVRDCLTKANKKFGRPN
ncbi:MAG: ribonuclease P protein component [Candidatus Obscuribacter sp.]|nr:ribonuclease P protein component [Candidatus Melainabacteria bacterium]MDX1989233.1 ribonuclease P protein component [Candidatus Obscuribacter sp.]